MSLIFNTQSVKHLKRNIGALSHIKIKQQQKTAKSHFFPK